MNKNLLIVGAVAVAGFTLTAFYGPTKADQMADIATKVTAGLDALRADEKAKCDARVEEAVAAQVAAMSAAPVETAPTLVATQPKGSKKPTAKGPKAPTVPTPAPPPTKPVDVKTRGGAEGAGEVKTRGGAAPEGKQEVKKRGGAVKVEGGGGK